MQDNHFTFFTRRPTFVAYVSFLFVLDLDIYIISLQPYIGHNVVRGMNPEHQVQVQGLFPHFSLEVGL